MYFHFESDNIFSNTSCNTIFVFHLCFCMSLLSLLAWMEFYKFYNNSFNHLSNFKKTIKMKFPDIFFWMTFNSISFDNFFAVMTFTNHFDAPVNFNSLMTSFSNAFNSLLCEIFRWFVNSAIWSINPEWFIHVYNLLHSTHCNLLFNSSYGDVTWISSSCFASDKSLVCLTLLDKILDPESLNGTLKFSN